MLFTVCVVLLESISLECSCVYKPCVCVCWGGEGWLMRQACKWRQYANDAQAPDSLFGDEKEGNHSEV